MDRHPLIKWLATGVTRELRGYLPDFPSDLSILLHPSWPDVFRHGGGWF